MSNAVPLPPRLDPQSPAQLSSRSQGGLTKTWRLAVASLAAFACLPAAQAAPPPQAFAYSDSIRPVSSNFFGMTVNKLGAHRNWPGMHTQVIRLWDTKTRWMDVEPARSQWDFSRIDMYVAYAQQHGADVLLTRGQPPGWAPAGKKGPCVYGNGCVPPADLADWREYVRAIATRYGSRIRYYELWNEPDWNKFWTGSPEQLAAMAQIAREEIKRANPNAKLIGPPPRPNGLQFFDKFLAAGGGTSLDAISFHFYLHKSIAELPVIIARTRAIAAAHGVDNLPLFATEFGVWCDDRKTGCDADASQQEAGPRVAKALFILAAEGVQNADYYFWESVGPPAPLGLAAAPAFGQLTEAGHLYSDAADLLAGSVITESGVDHGKYVIRFRKGGRDMVALWSDPDAGSFQLPGSWTYRSYSLLGGARIAPSANRILVLPADAIVIGST
jgi:hypothetical protein